MKEKQKQIEELILQSLNECDFNQKIEFINSIREFIHEYSPFKNEPVDFVKWVSSENVVANDYNPNKVAPPEMELLEISIMNDGYTQPVVTFPKDDKAVKDFFKPEFRNRLDAIIKFNKLEQISIRKIVGKFVQEMNDLLSDKHIKVVLSEKTTDYIISQGYDSKMGARPLARKINELIKVPLSKKILFDNINNCTVHVDFNDKIEFDIKEKQFVVYPTNNVIDENGYVILDQIKSNC